MKNEKVSPTIEEIKEIMFNEGNEKLFTHRGVQCLVLRMPMGHLNGYVSIPKDHAWSGKEYDEIMQEHKYEVPAHGGLTFSGRGSSLGNECLQDNWVIGFDTAHAGDLSIIMLARGIVFDRDQYRDMEYVENNLKEIVDYMLSV